jgi:3-hydroxybutyryl-CoA dehydrogenase
VRSRSKATADAMITSIEKGLDKQVSREKITAEDKAAILGRLSATERIADLADCDLVIESVVEDLAVKTALFAELDKAVKPGAILATNTSTLPVVTPITASDDTIAAANAFVAKCGKSGVQVKDRAGFIVNALLFPYLNNAIRIWETGTASMEDIDTAMKGGCNFPMGPFALLDLVGLDTSLSILEALHAEFADPNYAAVPTLRRLVAAGKLGRKSGEGFYKYQ